MSQGCRKSCDYFGGFYSSRKQSFQSVINPDWDFTKMGIGGLDKEFNAIFRRAFASRVFPPELTQQLGMYRIIRTQSVTSHYIALHYIT